MRLFHDATRTDHRGRGKPDVRLGVRFVQEPASMGPITPAVFDDTCGNLIQIAATN